ncbi:unnamed protein product [Leptidea sinapis]|uniref:Centriolar and ciliogenesis-associated protein HYLS1 C-terminal domain-containing protein n=1 Tax=Leptidea sinapis TaxID=189913 RepID=A0A5E4R1S0_9NEOP|nr:unnamed protein product [Leptidea sinapis]
MDNKDYSDITSHLDAREVLRYLNHLGIHNISGEVLKYFITDLKKLIKYDLQQKKSNEQLLEEGFERLHCASTFSSRSRSKVYDGEKLCCNKECKIARRPLGVRNIQSAPNIVQLKLEKPQRRACSCVRIEKKTDSQKDCSKTTTTISNNLIKVPKQQPKKKCDPVSLYHYYSSLWEKYKPHVPGENDWADIRWRIRQKMVNIDSQTSNKVSSAQNRNRIKKKDNS